MKCSWCSGKQTGKKTQTGLLEHIRVHHRDRIPDEFEFHGDAVSRYFSAEAELEKLSAMVHHTRLALKVDPIPAAGPADLDDLRELEGWASRAEQAGLDADQELAMDLDF